MATEVQDMPCPKCGNHTVANADSECTDADS